MLAASGNIPEAVARLQTHLEDHGEDAEVWRELAVVHRLGGNVNNAVDAAREYVNVANGDDAAKLFLVRLLMEIGQVSAADRLLQSDFDDPVQADIMRAEFFSAK